MYAYIIITNNICVFMGRHWSDQILAPHMSCMPRNKMSFPMCLNSTLYSAVVVAATMLRCLVQNGCQLSNAMIPKKKRVIETRLTSVEAKQYSETGYYTPAQNLYDWDGRIGVFNVNRGLVCFHAFPMWSVFQITLSFHYAGWWIGIPLLDSYNFHPEYIG